MQMSMVPDLPLMTGKARVAKATKEILTDPNWSL
jgi:hypothetical protein